ncbi:hypothetical protein CAPTEDRAFT_106793, partial [Capitella teleta]
RKKSDPKANLRVLEIGADAGGYFKYFPIFICLDSNPHLDEYSKKKIIEFPYGNLKEFIVGFAEDMFKVLDDSVDAAVCTLVLCSVNDPKKALKEIKRIFKPVSICSRAHYCSII